MSSGGSFLGPKNMRCVQLIPSPSRVSS
uniref:Uncharacterized protein n=1 Tax=Arundo donax TaxID=35708 RepID=A0A0A9A9P1_ARUDO